MGNRTRAAVIRSQQITGLSSETIAELMSLDPTGKGQARWTMHWKTALNAFDGRLLAARQ
ncbi:hypothetical protein AB0C51_23165 [Streptomyces pathocidini]|uniref:hypothetical protein n=1 Tax=Streptomyces pathocidini TaxID=1650571 RepID=UPI00340B0546